MTPNYPLNLTDAGRSTSSHPGQTMDCMVRALALVRSGGYDAAYDLFKAAGRRDGCRFKAWRLFDTQHWAEWTRFKVVKGKPRMTAAQFCSEHPHGVYVCKGARHVFAVIEGVVQDDVVTVTNRAWIFGFWKVLDRTKC